MLLISARSKNVLEVFCGFSVLPLIKMYWGEAKELIVEQVMVKEFPSITLPLDGLVIASVGVTVKSKK